MDNQLSKRRILMLQILLYKKTDEDHPLTTAEISAFFNEQKIVTDRRTVKSDIDLLIEMGHDIVLVKSTQNRYFVGSRDFETPEVKLLMDAVLASKFITEVKSEVLLRKLSKLVSVHQAESLQQHLYVSERIKPINETVYYSADMIRKAIASAKQITFKYLDYTPEKKKVMKHKGKTYQFMAKIMYPLSQ